MLNCSFIHFFLYKIEFCSNLICVYVYEAPFWKLELQFLLPLPHKYLYLCSDYYAKGARLSELIIISLVILFLFLYFIVL